MLFLKKYSFRNLVLTGITFALAIAFVSCSKATPAATAATAIPQVSVNCGGQACVK